MLVLLVPGEESKFWGGVIVCAREMHYLKKAEATHLVTATSLLMRVANCHWQCPVALLGGIALDKVVSLPCDQAEVLQIVLSSHEHILVVNSETGGCVLSSIPPSVLMTDCRLCRSCLKLNVRL